MFYGSIHMLHKVLPMPINTPLIASFLHVTFGMTAKVSYDHCWKSSVCTFNFLDLIHRPSHGRMNPQSG